METIAPLPPKEIAQSEVDERFDNIVSSAEDIDADSITPEAEPSAAEAQTRKRGRFLLKAVGFEIAGGLLDARGIKNGKVILTEIAGAIANKVLMSRKTAETDEETDVAKEKLVKKLGKSIGKVGIFAATGYATMAVGPDAASTMHDGLNEGFLGTYATPLSLKFGTLLATNAAMERGGQAWQKRASRRAEGQ